MGGGDTKTKTKKVTVTGTGTKGAVNTGVGKSGAGGRMGEDLLGLVVELKLGS